MWPPFVYLSFESQPSNSTRYVIWHLRDWQPSECKRSLPVPYYKCCQKPSHIGNSTWNQDKWEWTHSHLDPLALLPNVQTIWEREIRFIKRNPMLPCHKLGGLASSKQPRDIFLGRMLYPLAQPSVTCFLLPLKARGYRQLPLVHTPGPWKSSNSKGIQSPFKTRYQISPFIFLTAGESSQFFPPKVTWKCHQKNKEKSGDVLPRDLNRAKISSCLPLWARAGSSWSVTIPRGEQRGAERRRGHAAAAMLCPPAGDRGFEPRAGWMLGSCRVEHQPCLPPRKPDVGWRIPPDQLFLSAASCINNVMVREGHTSKRQMLRQAVVGSLALF